MAANFSGWHTPSYRSVEMGLWGLGVSTFPDQILVAVQELLVPVDPMGVSPCLFSSLSIGCWLRSLLNRGWLHMLSHITAILINENKIQYGYSVFHTPNYLITNTS